MIEMASTFSCSSKFVMKRGSQESELRFFFETLGVKFPLAGRSLENGYFAIDLPEQAGIIFNAYENRSVLLCFESNGIKYPISIFFITNGDKKNFGHSTMLLDIYEDDPSPRHHLQEATRTFFAQDPDVLLKLLCPEWTTIELSGSSDQRIFWQLQPSLDFLTDFMTETFAGVPTLPLFPSVYHYNNPYLKHLLMVAFEEIKSEESVLIMGCGAGIEAAFLAAKNKMIINAVDINPIAVANTKVSAWRTHTEELVNVWVSDAFSNVKEKYDVILFNAPLAIGTQDVNDENRFDREGKFLQKILTSLPDYLKINGRVLLMSHRDFSPYLPGNLECHIRLPFTVGVDLAILEIRAKSQNLPSHPSLNQPITLETTSNSITSHQ